MSKPDRQALIEKVEGLVSGALAAVGKNSGLLAGEEIVVSAIINRDGVDVNVRIERQVGKRKRGKIFDRPLTQEELAEIGAVQTFNKRQRELVDAFLQSGNAPMTLYDLRSVHHHIYPSEVNMQLGQANLPFGIYPLGYAPGRVRNSWSRLYCFRYRPFLQ